MPPLSRFSILPPPKQENHEHVLPKHETNPIAMGPIQMRELVLIGHTLDCAWNYVQSHDDKKKVETMGEKAIEKPWRQSNRQEHHCDRKNDSPLPSAQHAAPLQKIISAARDDCCRGSLLRKVTVVSGAAENSASASPASWGTARFSTLFCRWDASMIAQRSAFSRRGVKRIVRWIAGRVLRTRNVQIDDHRLLPAAYDHRLDRFVSARIQLLMGN